MSANLYDDPLLSTIYAKHRPKLPQKVLDSVLQYLSEKIKPENWEIAVDVGCGSGQCTNALAPHFMKVYGFDLSATQISEANKLNDLENVNFYVSSADSLTNIESNSAQLITASSAAHWFDLDKFFIEANRVLAPNGVLALIAPVYQTIDLENPDNHSLNNILIDTFLDPILTDCNENIHAYKSQFSIWLNCYKSIKFPHYFDYQYTDNIRVTEYYFAQKIIGLIQSFESYQTLFRGNQSEAEKFLSNVENKLKHLLNVKDISQKELLWDYRYFIAFGRKLIQ